MQKTNLIEGIIGAGWDVTKAGVGAGVDIASGLGRTLVNMKNPDNSPVVAGVTGIGGTIGNTAYNLANTTMGKVGLATGAGLLVARKIADKIRKVDNTDSDPDDDDSAPDILPGGVKKRPTQTLAWQKKGRRSL